MVVVEVQVLQVRADHGDGVDQVVGQLQVQQGGNIEHAFGKPFVTQLIAVQSHKRQMIHVFEVIPEEQMKRKLDGSNPGKLIKACLSRTRSERK